MTSDETLLNAVRTANVPRLKELLNREPNAASFRDDDGFSLIHIAVMQEGGQPVIRELINAGCDINAIDNEGKTPLRWACDLSSHLDIKYLISRGARIDIRDHNGVLPVVPTASLVDLISRNVGRTHGAAPTRDR